MLNLILTDRHQIAVVQQNVSCHQDRVREQPGVSCDPLSLFVLVGVALLQQMHLRDRHQQPRQLSDLGHIRLDIKCRLRGIEPQCQQVESGIGDVRLQVGRIPYRRQRMQIGNEIQSCRVILQFDVLADGPEVVSPVNLAGRLNAREDAHG